MSTANERPRSRSSSCSAPMSSWLGVAGEATVEPLPDAAAFLAVLRGAIWSGSLGRNERSGLSHSSRRIRCYFTTSQGPAQARMPARRLPSPPTQRRPALLLKYGEIGSPVLCPVLIRVVRRYRIGGTVAHARHSRAVHAGGDEGCLDRVRSLLREDSVRSGIARVVRVSFETDL